MKMDSADIIASGCVIGVLAIIVTFIIIYIGRYGYKITKEEFNIYQLNKKSPLLACLGIFYLGFSIKPGVGLLVLRSGITSTVGITTLVTSALFVGAALMIFYVMNKNRDSLGSLINSRDKNNKNKTILVNSIFGRISFSFPITGTSNNQSKYGINADNFFQHGENKSKEFIQDSETKELIKNNDIRENSTSKLDFNIGTLQRKAVQKNTLERKNINKVIDNNEKNIITLQKNKETKECPKCAEAIKFNAVICRFCKYDFETDNFRE